LRLLLAQLPLPLFLFFRQVMPDRATRHGPDEGMVARHVPRHRTNGGALDTASCLGLVCVSEDCQSHYGYNECLQHCPAWHWITP
jgi:hypothetical protein